MPFLINPKTSIQTLNQINQLISKIGQHQLSSLMSIHTHQRDPEVDNQLLPQFYYQFWDSVEQWKVDYFVNCSERMNFSEILNRISHINFTNLSILCLVGCQIDNFESISWLGCQNQLKQLQICQNKIYSLQPISKCKFKNILHLGLGKNKMSQMQIKKLSRAQLPKCLERFEISQQGETYHDIDLRYVSNYVPVSKYSTTMTLVKNMPRLIKHLDVECINERYSIPEKANISLHQRSSAEVQNSD